MASKIACLNRNPFGLKIGHKIPPRCSQDAHVTAQDGPKRPKTSPRRLQDASKTTRRRLPDGPRYSQDAPKTALNSPRHPKMLPIRPKTPQRRLQTSILVPPGLNCWRFFHVKLLIVGSFGDHFLDANSYQITCHFIPEYVKI